MNGLWRWLPVVLWAWVIWDFSSSGFSSIQSSRFILPFLRWLLPQASAATLDVLHLLIRKSGHVAEYYILSLLLLRALAVTRGGWRLGAALLALAIAAAYSGVDEIHQAFVPNRTASVWDSLLDTAAAALAQLTVWWWTKRGTRTPGRVAAGDATTSRSS